MPRKLPTRCRKPGCPALTLNRFCTIHINTTANHATSRDSIRNDEDTNRNFYKSSPWRKLRAAVLKAENYRCRTPKCPNTATMVDHITPITEGGEQLDASNCQPLCNPCHQRKRQKESLKARGF